MKKYMVALAALSLLGACSTGKPVVVDQKAEKPAAAQTLTIEEAQRILRAKVIDLNHMDISGDWYEAVVQFPNGSKAIAYVDGTKRNIVSGAIFDATTGANLTARRMSDLGILDVSPKMQSGSLDVAKVVDALDGFPVFRYWNGKGKPDGIEPLRVVVDPRCPFCHRAWPTVMAYSTRVPVDVYVVGYLGPQSEQIAAALLARPQTGMVDKVMRGKAQPTTSDAKMVGKVKVMSSKLVNLGVSGVPLFIRGGKYVKGFGGEQVLRPLL